MTSLWSRVLAVAVIASAPAAASAQEDGDSEEDETKTIEDFTEGFDRQDGLFPLYTDPDNGKLYMEIAADQLDDEFIYFLYTENGTPQARHFRGSFRGSDLAARPLRIGFEPAIGQVLGLSTDTLSAQWRRAVEQPAAVSHRGRPGAAT